MRPSSFTAPAFGGWDTNCTLTVAILGTMILVTVAAYWLTGWRYDRKQAKISAERNAR